MALKRKLYTGNNYQKAISIDDLYGIARKRVPSFVLEYVVGGAEDENSLNWNLQSLKSIRFKPNTLVDTSTRHQRINLFEKESSSPLIIAPTGLNGMLHHRADIALAKSAKDNNIPFCLSTVSNVRLEEVAEESAGRLWMQLYVMTNRDITRNILQRAEEENYEALVFTTDANVFGNREWDKRNYRAPAKLTMRNIMDVACHPRWMFDVLIPHGVPRFENIVKFMPPEAKTAKGGVAIFPKLFAPEISWDEVAWLREKWPRKLILKGILNAADAIRAAELGCDGIIISNHGGRQLDSCVAPIEVLPEIVEAVGDKMTIIVDSGFRRGIDVLKAIALGANAVMIGRATLFGLAAGGHNGVNHALSILTTEIDRALGQLGCNSINDLNPEMLVNNIS
ncbi:MAG: alpha-hydroxy acid oxidase [Gammaproteobacteria bacterium]